MQGARVPKPKRPARGGRKLVAALLCGLFLLFLRMLVGSALFVHRPVFRGCKQPPRTCKHWDGVGVRNPRCQHESRKLLPTVLGVLSAWESCRQVTCTEVCRRTRRRATASSDESKPAPQSFGVNLSPSLGDLFGIFGCHSCAL